MLASQEGAAAQMEALVARACVVVGASRRAVWDALLTPATITKIMPVSEVVSEWRLGEPFEWTFDMNGTRLSVRGLVHRMEPERLFEYEYVDPHSMEFLHVENVHQVTIELSDEAGCTRVAVVQDANVTKATHLHAEGGWRLALNNLKSVVEMALRAPPLPVGTAAGY
jgi:uncharacterized protein YndB with AHSA1/START domain